MKVLFGPIRLGALTIAAATALAIPQAHAANIIGFANNATACGGSTLCSTNAGPLPTGTEGYVETGSRPFNLSTINQWFQIDPDRVSHLPYQPAEPLGDAGNFLVVNDTGAVVTNFSLTLTDTFTASSPAVTHCGASLCENFQIHGGAANYFSVFTLTGPNCYSGCDTASANFTPGTVTYNWAAGSRAGIPVGATFNLNFASWNNDVAAVPIPAAAWLFVSGLVGLIGIGRRKLAARTWLGEPTR